MVTHLIPHSKPWLLDEDALALKRILNSCMLAQGDAVKQFERAISSWVEADDGVAVGSGSAAVALALRALGVGRGDEVVLPTYICKSVAEAVLEVGAVPVLCDVRRNWIMSPDNAFPYLTSRTRALIVPHMYGIFADIEQFRQLGVPIIEDSAQAIGYRAQRTIAGDVTVFSFHPTKCLTTGEGGMAVSRDATVAKAMRLIRDGHRDATIAPRLLSPLSDLAAALGLAQLERYEKGLDRRRELATRYRAVTEAVIPGAVNDDAFLRSMHFRFPITVSGGFESYQAQFAKRQIMVRRGVDRLLHRLMGLPDSNFPVAVALFETTVSLPIYPALTDEEFLRCTTAVAEIFRSSDKNGAISETAQHTN